MHPAPPAAPPAASPAASTDVLCHGERLTLLAERAVHWPARRTLLVADLHLGKEEVFARAGIPIPRGPSETGLARLAALVAATASERLVVLGDLMHAVPASGEPWLAALAGFLDHHAELAVEVVAGNHDRAAGRERLDRRLVWHEAALVEAPFVLRHEPEEDARGYTLGGHLHPVCRLGGGRRGERLRLPAFWFRRRAAVLPAFGDFTGGLRVRPGRGERLFAAGPGCVVDVSGDVPGSASARRGRRIGGDRAGVGPSG